MNHALKNKCVWYIKYIQKMDDKIMPKKKYTQEFKTKTKIIIAILQGDKEIMTFVQKTISILTWSESGSRNSLLVSSVFRCRSRA